MPTAQENRLNPWRTDDPSRVKVEKHKAGEKCRHWVAGPDGRMTYDLPNFCILCYGTGKLIVDVNLRFHSKSKKMLHTYYPSELPDTEYMPSSARKPYEGKVVPRTVA